MRCWLGNSFDELKAASHGGCFANGVDILEIQGTMQVPPALEKTAKIDGYIFYRHKVFNLIVEAGRVDEVKELTLDCSGIALAFFSAC